MPIHLKECWGSANTRVDRRHDAVREKGNVSCASVLEQAMREIESTFQAETAERSMKLMSVLTWLSHPHDLWCVIKLQLTSHVTNYT